jgi:nucleotide-binding universal stress UspA family protein
MAPRARNILVGYDGTDSGRRALAAAADLVGYASTLSVAAVVPQDDSAESADLVREARAQLLRHHVLARYLQPAGELIDVLIETSRKLGIDLLVVGRTAGSRPSQATGAVIASAPCDILIVA